MSRIDSVVENARSNVFQQLRVKLIQEDDFQESVLKTDTRFSPVTFQLVKCWRFSLGSATGCPIFHKTGQFEFLLFCKSFILGVISLACIFKVLECNSIDSALLDSMCQKPDGTVLIFQNPKSIPSCFEFSEQLLRPSQELADRSGKATTDVG